MGNEMTAEHTTCPHCGKSLPAEVIVDDFSGCPLEVKCCADTMNPRDAWPMATSDEDAATSEAT